MKAAAQCMAAVLAAIMPLFLTNEALTLTEWINVGIVAAGAITVYVAANQPPGDIWNYTKVIMSAVSAAGVIVLSSSTGGWPLSQVEVIQIGVAVISVFTVEQIPGPATVPGRHAKKEEE